MKRYVAFWNDYQAAKALVNSSSRSVLSRKQRENVRIIFADASKVKTLAFALVPVIGYGVHTGAI